MSSGYRLHHPKWYRERTPIFWWTRRPAYVKFILRELTSLAVVWTAAVVVAEIWSLARGGETYHRFLELLRSTPLVVVDTFAFAALLFHSITWLNLAPKALVLHVGGRRLPDAVVVTAHYTAWVAGSAVVAWVLLRS